MILETGTTKHMSSLLNIFITLTKVKDYYVTLGDGITKLHVMGKDITRIYIESYIVELHNVLFVPDLEATRSQLEWTDSWRKSLTRS